MEPSRLVALAVLAAGCAHGPAPAPPKPLALPPGLAANDLGPVAAGAPVAWNPLLDRLAIVRQGIVVVDPATGRGREVSRRKPDALSFAPDGTKLLAAFPGPAGETALEVLDFDGLTLIRTTVPARVTWVGWTDVGGVLAIARDVEVRAFGTHVRLTLYRWDDLGPPKPAVLGETTLMPGLARQLAGELAAAVQATTSPLGDEIAFTRVVSPPDVRPRREAVVHNLASGAQRVAVEVEPAAASAAFSPDGDRVVPGALSPGGRWSLAGGILRRDGAVVATLPPGSAGSFSPSGAWLLVQSGGRALAVGPIADPGPPQPEPKVRERLVELRAWRAEGLVTEDEYRAARQGVGRP